MTYADPVYRRTRDEAQNLSANSTNVHAVVGLHVLVDIHYAPVADVSAWLGLYQENNNRQGRDTDTCAAEFAF